MKPFLISLTLFSLLSCGGSQFDKERITQEVRQMLTSYHNDIREYGLTAEFGYLDTSANFFWIPPGFGRALGYDTVRAIIERNAVSMGTVDLHWDTLTVYPLTPEIANFTGTVSGWTADASGEQTAVSMIESGTVIKREDGWKLLSGQTAVINAASTQAREKP